MAGEQDIAGIITAQVIDAMIQNMGEVSARAYITMLGQTAQNLYADLTEKYAQLQSIDAPNVERRTVARSQAVDYVAASSVNDMLNQAAAQVDLATAETITQIGKVYRKTYNNRWRAVTAINQEVGQMAIRDMVEHFDEVYSDRHPNGGPPSGYRQGNRYSGGMLRSALSSPLQATASLDGVIFGDTALLDATARHWARLNFGAGPRAGVQGGSRPFMLTEYGGKRFSASQEFFNDALGGGKIKLPFVPKGAFTMPAGIFTTDGTTKGAVPANMAERGQHAFYPRSRASKNRQDPIITQGVEAWGFIDAGVASVARNLGPANADFMLRIFEEAADNSKSIVQRTLPTITPAGIGDAIRLLRG